MRDFRDAKAMATSLRQALPDKNLTITHSDALELVSKALGLDNWNILAAKIEAERPRSQPAEAEPGPKTLYCSFCSKSQHDVATLIAGPSVFICDGCVGLCDGILFDKRLERALAEAQSRDPGVTPLDAASQALASYPDGQLEATRKGWVDWLDHVDWSLRQITASLAGQAVTPWRSDEAALKRGWTDPLKGKSRDELTAQQANLTTIQAGVQTRLDLLDEVLRRRAATAPA
jgi:hypothetical protein